MHEALAAKVFIAYIYRSQPAHRVKSCATLAYRSYARVAQHVCVCVYIDHSVCIYIDHSPPTILSQRKYFAMSRLK